MAEFPIFQQGVVGDKGPEGWRGWPGLPRTASNPSGYESGEWTGPSGSELPEGVLEEAEAKSAARGISLQDITSSKKVAATETGAVVLMPQEFDADNVKAYIQQEIEAGVKEHQTALMRKVADVLADTITQVRNAAKSAAREQQRRVEDSRTYLDAHLRAAEKLDKKRALDIAELQIKVAELEGSLTLKMQETKVLRKKLHAASIKKHVRKIKRRNYGGTGPSESTSEPGDGGSEVG